MQKQMIVGWLVLAITLVLGTIFLATDILVFRLIIGLVLGYTLARAYIGFAGSVNRAYANGSTKLMRILMGMFFITAVFHAGLYLYNGTQGYNIGTDPINFALIIGGLLFGFGMSFSMCCGSGVLAKMSSNPLASAVTLFFFMVGVFFGFPLQRGTSFVKDSWITTAGDKGIFLPNAFGGQTATAYALSLAVTGALCLLVVWLSYKYENKRKKEGTYFAIEREEVIIEKPNPNKQYQLFSMETYNKLFVQPWRLELGALIIAVAVVIMMIVTHKGWGASTPFGLWFGKLLIGVGFDAQAIADFTHWNVKKYTSPFFEHQTSVQNVGIILGALIFSLQSGRLFGTWKANPTFDWRAFAIAATGGFTMGIGTRLANGCNLGGLYTPIASFSLSGWFFLIFMVIGGVVGNKLLKKTTPTCKV